MDATLAAELFEWVKTNRVPQLNEEERLAGSHVCERDGHDWATALNGYVNGEPFFYYCCLRYDTIETLPDRIYAEG